MGTAAFGGAALTRWGVHGALAVRWPLVLCLGLLATAAFGCALGGARGRTLFAPAAASLRLSAVFLTIALWRGEARELWGALAVWVAWHDAEEGLSHTRPLLPVATALAVALAWSGYRPGPAATRAVAVGLVAGWAAARGARGRPRET
jgi:hypothetical protein